jgi:hypothetical protein
MGNGLNKILQLYGAMTVSANGNTAKWVWDYNLNKSRLRKEMTDEEWMASEKAKYEQLKNLADNK